MIDKSGMTAEGEFALAGFEHAQRYEALAELARHFVATRPWCKEVSRVYFDRGFEQMAVFYCEVGNETPNSVWAVVGDLPPAVLSTSHAGNGVEALLGYIGGMRDNLIAIRRDEPLSEFFPVLSRNGEERVEITSEVRLELEQRLRFIASRFLPEYPEELRRAGFTPRELRRLVADLYA